MCCRFSSRSRCCLCTVLVIHLVIAASLTVALVLRMYVYRDIEFLDMPTDQRLLHRGVSSIFCSHHSLESVLTAKNDGKINDEASFLYYTLTRHPADDPSIGVQRVQQNLFSEFGFGKRDVKDNVFNLMVNSTVKLDLCRSKYQMAPVEIYYYVTVGMKSRKRVLNAIEKGEPLKDCSWCLKAGHHELEYCSVSTVSLSITAHATEDYSFIFLNPGNDTAVVDAKYALQRNRYNLTNGCGPKESAQVHPEDFIVVEYENYRTVSEYSLVNIQLSYVCDPQVMIYMAFFFWLPLVLLVAVGVFALYRQSRTGEYNLLSTASHSNSYGAVHS